MRKPVIFNHDVADSFGDNPLGVSHAEDAAAAAAQWDTLFRYGGRVLCATEPGDVIQLDPALQPSWDWISDHYAAVGLPATRNVVWNTRFEVAGHYPGYRLDTFYFGHRAHAVRPNQRWYHIVAAMNSKNRLIKLARECGVRVPETWLFGRKADLYDTGRFPYPVYLKVAVSVSGLGVMYCPDQATLEAKLALLGNDVAFQIQREVAGVRAFLNAQYHVDPVTRRLTRGLASVQVLKGASHDGNRHPTEYEPWGVCDPVARVMAKRGMIGWFAFDVAVTEDGEYYLIECNPRWNGATFPSTVAQRLGIRQWIAKNFAVRATSLDNVELNGLGYRSSHRTGAIVFNWGIIGDHKLGIMIVGTPNEQARIAGQLEDLLG